MAEKTSLEGPEASVNSLKTVREDILDTLLIAIAFGTNLTSTTLSLRI